MAIFILRTHYPYGRTWENICSSSRYLLLFLIQYLSRGIQFSRASLNGALTCMRLKYKDGYKTPFEIRLKRRTTKGT